MAYLTDIPCVLCESVATGCHFEVVVSHGLVIFASSRLHVQVLDLACEMLAESNELLQHQLLRCGAFSLAQLVVVLAGLRSFGLNVDLLILGPEFVYRILSNP